MPTAETLLEFAIVAAGLMVLPGPSNLLILAHGIGHGHRAALAAAGTPLRTLQGWMGHRDYKTTEIYADFAPDPTQGAVWAERAFGTSDVVEGAATEPHVS